ncbi:alpha/beta hydrolase [Sphingomonas sp. RP10(2022)]|uniref:Alpha/beta hydrolase n=2 Tax=Sphingomonas liriopis TaxID=2949094 RepID=A0A9X2KRQ8_9SPHN|nr:alpha/beta hydrolase [Sphingomonas liriopis]MCP3735866.1 alpha/beta hydrolase [Sphingomonas liriopis]
MRYVVLAAALALATPAAAQITVIPAPAQPAAIPLDTGDVAGAREAEGWLDLAGQRVVRNVRSATLTPFLPPPGKATGAAVIVAPGGGFAMLSMDNEGWPVARWLADHGIAAFVLKYRLRQTPADPKGFLRDMGAVFATAMRPGPDLAVETSRDAVADGLAALALVRRRAGEWHVDPARVGMLGFSAGAMTTLGVVEAATPETMPAFAAPIYGPMRTITVPAAAPPMFAAMASDDPLFARKGFGLIEAWQAARKPVEFHLYQKGGHGYGMGAKGTTSTGWIASFHDWLAMNGFLKARP